MLEATNNEPNKDVVTSLLIVVAVEDRYSFKNDNILFVL
jgi:hypothetical protein